MKPTTQRGMALVITLIMLSVVTVMAIVFLGISRRERASVGVTGNMIDARLASDAGLARAQAEIIARMAARSNLLDYDFFVSTNYISSVGFIPNLIHPTNVNYYYSANTNNPVAGDDQLQNLANLFIDPRPPVYVSDLVTGRQDFRFYLDVNRNGWFETNGWVPVVSGGLRFGTNWLWGDPEWVGILERPEYPHSGTNRFVARYAYLALPASKTLDFNFIHNDSKLARPGQEGIDFLRNQGVGSWELNLAAFFARWLPAMFSAANPSYDYLPEVPGANRGRAFDLARTFVRHRRDGIRGPSAADLLRNAAMFRTNGVDDFGDDLGPRTADEDDIGRPWPAADNLNRLHAIDDLFSRTNVFDPNPLGAVGAPTFGEHLLLAGSLLNDTTNRYAFSRMLAQIGVDSLPAGRGRIHLNFRNAYWNVPALQADGRWNLAARTTNGAAVFVDGAETNMEPWALTSRGRTDFLMVSGDRILRSQMGFLFPRGLADGIQVYPTNLYIGATHRCLQMAANLLDTATRQRMGTATNFVEFPTVFRPVYAQSALGGTNIIAIVGFEEVTNAVPLFGERWYDLSKPAGRQAVQTALTGNEKVNISGVPWVIGAKKRWPNFNEFYLENMVTVTRRLQATKNPRTKEVTFQQSYELGITNFLGFESWNAYQTNFPGTLRLVVTNLTDLVLRDGTADNNRGTPASVVKAQTLITATNHWVTNWLGNAFQVSTNRLAFVPKAAYFPGARQGSQLVPALPSVQFDRTVGFPIPDWKLEVSGRLTYALLSTDALGNARIVDLVTLDPVTAGFDINRWLIGETNRFAQTNRADNRFWATNRVGALRRNNIVLDNATAGITNQIFVSTNDVLARSDWTSYSEDPIAGMQKERAIDEFRVFLGMPPLFDRRRTNTPALTMQVPFSASRRMVQRLSWMANDPLVHYHVEDLFDEKYADTNLVVVMRPGGGDEGYSPNLPNLGEINPRYQPWGGAPGRLVVNDEWAYNEGVKDPWITRADDWEFPTNMLASVGWMGRVHRGTPWQTVYLKAAAEPPAQWLKYMGRPTSPWLHPTNDWRLVDLFTAAPNANATRGLLSVNQTNPAAWAAVLGGLRYRTNTTTASRDPSKSASYAHSYVETTGPRSTAFENIVLGINTNRARFQGGTFPNLGDILSTPALTTASPFLNLNGLRAGTAKISDAVLEDIPQNILGLLRKDEPYFVVYSYGQSLRPAERSLVLNPNSPFYNLCTNYQITGEALTKTGFRVVEHKEGTNVFYEAVLEDFRVLPLN